MVWPEDSASQLLGCLEHLQTGALQLKLQFGEQKIITGGINQGSRADDGERTLVFGLKILV